MEKNKNVFLKEELSEIILGIKEELKLSQLDNFAQLCKLIGDNEEVVMCLENLYQDEEGIEVDFDYLTNNYFYTFNNIADEEYLESANAFLDFVNSCGDVHDDIMSDIEDVILTYCDTCLDATIESETCEICGGAICKECLEDEGVHSEDNNGKAYSICGSCLEKIDVTNDELEQIIDYYVMGLLEAYNYIKDGEIRVFYNVEDYIGWMYSSEQDKSSLVDSIIYDQINTGNDTLADYLIQQESRAIVLNSDKVIFFFEY